LPANELAGSIGAGHVSLFRTLQTGPVLAGISGAFFVGGKGMEDEEGIAIQGRADSVHSEAR
jgi:hypothetical protein